MRWCAASGVRLVHVSTDLVFDGENAPYAPGDEPRHELGGHSSHGLALGTRGHDLLGLAQLVHVAGRRDALAEGRIGMVAQPGRSLHDVRIGVVDESKLRDDQRRQIGLDGNGGAVIGTIITGLFSLIAPTKIEGFTGIRPIGGRGITEESRFRPTVTVGVVSALSRTVDFGDRPARTIA